MILLLLVVFHPVFSNQKHPCTLHLSKIDLSKIDKNDLDPDALFWMEKSHIAGMISVENLPKKNTSYNVKIERPLFKDMDKKLFTSMPERIVKIYSIDMLAYQKRISYKFPVLLNIVSAGYLPGEKINVILLNKKKKELGKLSWIPNPIEKTFSDEKAKITIEYTLLKNSWYTVTFSGFEKGEVVKVESSSGFEKLPATDFNVDQKRMRYSNGVIGGEGGVSCFTVVRKNGEKIVFKLPWGKSIFPYLRGEIPYGKEI
ncbi:MAG: hypothetical protein ACE5RS_07365 [Nitrosopumilus sp.]